MAKSATSFLVNHPPAQLFGEPPAGGDYRYYLDGGCIHLVLLTPRAVKWFQDEVYADALEWLSPTEPKLPWGAASAEVLRMMRVCGLRKEKRWTP